MITPYLDRANIEKDVYKQYGPALQDYTSFLKKKPGDKAVMFQIAEIYFITKDFQHTITQCSNILSFAPDDGNTFYLRASAEAEIKNYGLAFSDGERAKQLGINIDDNTLQQWMLLSSKNQ
jgi:tetratricopeptide (TPR) repeat protein